MSDINATISEPENINISLTGSAGTLPNGPTGFRGSDCSGSHGTKGRILTLPNTSTTKSILVYRNGAYVHETSLTIVHNATSSTITFTDLFIFNTDFIDVLYFT